MLDKINKTGAQMLDYVYHISLKYLNIVVVFLA